MSKQTQEYFENNENLIAPIKVESKEGVEDDIATKTSKKAYKDFMKKQEKVKEFFIQDISKKFEVHTAAQ